MKSRSQTLVDAAESGSIASLLSTAVLALRGQQEDGTPYGPTNAVSHWFFGDEAFHEDGFSPSHTVTGYATHHVSSIFWAYFYERWFGDDAERGAVAPALLGGAAVAGMACFVDYELTPKRFQPGYENRLSKPSLFLTYAAIAAALPLRGLLAGRR
ncbi:MAG: hypothetical protein ACTHKB_10130 [Burkholderiaceae bacterium]